MRSVIIYGGVVRSVDKDQRLYRNWLELGFGASLGLRTEVVEAAPLEALDRATPREGETVINTLPMPG